MAVFNKTRSEVDAMSDVSNNGVGRQALPLPATNIHASLACVAPPSFLQWSHESSNPSGSQEIPEEEDDEEADEAMGEEDEESDEDYDGEGDLELEDDDEDDVMEEEGEEEEGDTAAEEASGGGFWCQRWASHHGCTAAADGACLNFHGIFPRIPI